MNKEGHRHRILLVDDDVMVSSSLKDFLEQYKIYDVEVENNPKKALERIKKDCNYDALLVDQKMPEMTGVEFIKEIIPYIEKLPVKPIIWGVTAEDDGVMQQQAENQLLPLDDYVKKPWEPTDFTIRFREALRKRDMIAGLLYTVENHSVVYEEMQFVFLEAIDELSKARESNAILRGSIMSTKAIRHPLGNIIAGMVGRNEEIYWIFQDEFEILTDILEKIQSNEITNEKLIAIIKNDIIPLIEKLPFIKERFDSLISRLKGYSIFLNAITEKEVQESVVNCNLQDIIDSSLKFFSEKKLINVNIDKNYGKSVNISCYKSLLTDAFYHVLDNSFKSMPEGGNLAIQIEPNKTKVKVRITDSGIGIPDESIPNVFIPLFTEGREVYGGVGGSLAHKYITDYHRGTIKILESFTTDMIDSGKYPERNQGTSVEITLQKKID